MSTELVEQLIERGGVVNMPTVRAEFDKVAATIAALPRDQWKESAIREAEDTERARGRAAAEQKFEAFVEQELKPFDREEGKLRAAL